MTTRILVTAIAAMSMTLGACLETDEVSETTEKILPERCSNIVCSANKARLADDSWFHELKLGGANDDEFPVTLSSFRTADGRDLQIIRDEVRRVPTSTDPGGPISNAELVGASMELEEGGHHYQIRFGGMGQDVDFTFQPSSKKAHYRELLVRQVLPWGGATAWVDVCKPGNANQPTGDINARFAVLFNGDHFDFEAGTVTRTLFDGPSFNVACAGTPMALMYQRRVVAASELDGTQVPDALRNQIFQSLLNN